MKDIHGFETRENCFGDGERLSPREYDAFRDEPTDEDLERASCEIPTVCSFCNRKLDERGAHLSLVSLRFCLQKERAR